MGDDFPFQRGNVQMMPCSGIPGCRKLIEVQVNHGELYNTVDGTKSSTS